MRHQNITFSIPVNLKASLQAHIGKRGMSQFISQAISKALEEEVTRSEQELDAAYEAANKDSDRLETLKDCNMMDDTSDLSNEEDWSWLKSPNDKKKK